MLINFGCSFTEFVLTFTSKLYNKAGSFYKYAEGWVGVSSSSYN
jgi:hypothetical protein